MVKSVNFTLHFSNIAEQVKPGMTLPNVARGFLNRHEMQQFF